MMRFLEFLESLSHGDTLDDIDEAFAIAATEIMPLWQP